MKKAVLLSLALSLSLPLGAAFAAPAPAQTASPSAIVQQKQAAPAVSVQKLAIGTVTTYDYGNIKMYAYATNDPLSDECYALESKDGVVLLESTILTNNINEWSQFVKTLDKPVVAELMSYHPNGYAAYGKHPIYATPHALQSWQPGGGVYTIVGNLEKAFGSAADTSMPAKAKKLTAGKDITLAGIRFHIIDAGDDAYSVEIPQINAVYRHMMGSDVHNILASRQQIAQDIQTLKGYQQKGYDLILTGHYKPEGQTAVAQKIQYLQKVQELAETCQTKDEFQQRVKEAFPNYQGESYLAMTASFLYQR